MDTPPDGDQAPGRHDLRTGNRVGTVVLAAATIAGVVVCFLLAAPFLGAITGALAFAILFAPVHARIETALRSRNLAAIVSVLVLALVVVLPIAFIVERLVEEAAAGAASIRALIDAGAVNRLLELHPVIGSVLEWIEEKIGIPAIVGNLSAWLSGVGASFARGSIAQAIQIAVTFYLLFYFLRDRKAVTQFIRDWIPLTAEETDRLFRRVGNTVHATVYGTLLVSAVQGTLGGLMFWMLGLPAALLWGVVMAVLSIVPVLGAFVIWIPAAVLLALSGAWIKALVLALWGALVVGGIDNILRPILVGNRLQLHTVPLFISLIGGLLLFGASGFILGPLAVTVTLLLIEIWTPRRAPPVSRAE